MKESFNKKRITLFMLCCALLVSSFSGLLTASASTPSEFILGLFDAKVFTSSDGLKLNYRIYVPDDYNPDKTYPLILFMHGAGEKDTDNKSQLGTGIPSSFNNANSRIYDCIVIAPQCPPDKKCVNVATWNDCNYSTDAIPETPEMKAIVELFLKTQEEYSVDKDRVYATGLSMGGIATLDLAVRHPKLFAAIIPVCGGGDNRKADLLADMPIWTFHGDADPTVPITGMTNMVNSLKAAGNTKVKYTIYQGRGHDVWPDVYSNEAIYMWLLTYKRSDRPSVKEEETNETPTEEITEPITQPPVNETEEPTKGEETTNAPVENNEGYKGSVGTALPLLLIPAGAALLSKKKRSAR